MSPEIGALSELFLGGSASSDELARGMHLSYRNAELLLQDATHLLASSPGRALSLAILAMEETAKVFILFEIAIKSGGEPIAGDEVRKGLRSHATKQRVLASYGMRILTRAGAPYQEEIPSAVVASLDRMKQLGFYVDLAHEGFVSPEIFGSTNVDWANWSIAVASERLRSIAAYHRTEEASREFLRQGIEWLRELAQHVEATGGVDSPEAMKAVEQFLRERLGAP